MTKTVFLVPSVIYLTISFPSPGILQLNISVSALSCEHQGLQILGFLRWVWPPMACVHEQCPSPSLSGFSTPISDAPFRRPDSDVAACTPDTELTPTQCVLRNVLSIDPVVDGSHTRGNTPTPSDDPAQFSNSVLKLHEGGAEGGAMRNQSESFRLQAGGGGFLEGLFGCLKPVWTMIGKAYSTENKQSHEGKEKLTLTCIRVM